MALLRLYKARSESSVTEGANEGADGVCVGTQHSTAVFPSLPLPSSPNTTPSAHDEPLRLSEISPRKAPLNDHQHPSASRTGSPQDGQQRAMSPMRRGKKRPSMDRGRSPTECRKKGRTVLPGAESERGSSEEEGSIPQPWVEKNTHHEDQPVTNSETREVTRHSGFPKSTLPHVRTKYRPKLNCSPQRKGPSAQGFPYSSNVRQVHGTITMGKGKYVEAQPKASITRSTSSLNSPSASSRYHRHATRMEGKNSRSVRARERSGPSSTAELPLFEKQLNTTSTAQLTRPVAFTFRVDARLEARKAEERTAASEQGSMMSRPLLHAVPDIKTLQESRQVALGCRKENNVPSRPVMPFFFSTEQRAKERERFDEMVRRKEEEMERLKEEQRRLEAEEEDRAIMELRRKAIPKANSVPEWYAGMPKRKGTAV
ncbi:hypothetical protein BU15DRAFT_51475 [Melanogaster broomeanus]|nr:hypothetical protein BU15DRAFT_51475 [Melanogaster broomeanus]